MFWKDFSCREDTALNLCRRKYFGQEKPPRNELLHKEKSQRKDSKLTFNVTYPVDTGRKLNVHKTFRRRPGRLLNVLCTFNLRPVSTGQYFDLSHQGRMWILTWYRSVLLKRCSFQMFLLEPLFQQRCRPKPCNFIKKETLA